MTKRKRSSTGFIFKQQTGDNGSDKKSHIN